MVNFDRNKKQNAINKVKRRRKKKTKAVCEKLEPSEGEHNNAAERCRAQRKHGEERSRRYLVEWKAEAASFAPAGRRGDRPQ
jgi:hypothetical protein